MFAGFGIWTRGDALVDLQRIADDAAVPRVQVATPKPGPTEPSLILPGSQVIVQSLIVPMSQVSRVDGNRRDPLLATKPAVLPHRFMPVL